MLLPLRRWLFNQFASTADRMRDSEAFYRELRQCGSIYQMSSEDIEQYHTVSKEMLMRQRAGRALAILEAYNRLVKCPQPLDNLRQHVNEFVSKNPGSYMSWEAHQIRKIARRSCCLQALIRHAYSTDRFSHDILMAHIKQSHFLKDEFARTVNNKHSLRVYTT